MNEFRKLRVILTSSELKSAIVLLFLMFIGTILEMLGVGMMFPVMVVLGQNDLAVRHPIIKPILEYLGNPSQSQLIAGAMLGLLLVYMLKNLFLIFLTWRQSRFTYGIYAQLAQRLFSAYLRQPYTFHLQRNSVQLGHTVIERVNVFTSAINNYSIIITEGLALFGIGGFLLVSEPQGVMIVVTMMALVIWIFHFITKGRISRWGVARQMHNDLGNLHMHQGFGSVKDIKVLGRERNFLAQFKVHSDRGGQIAGSQAILQQLPRLWLELLAVAGLSVVVLSMISQGVGTDRIMPTLGLFSAAAFRLIPSVNRVLGGFQFIRYSMPTVNFLYDEVKLMATNPEVKPQSDSAASGQLQTEIRLNDICFSYPSAVNLALDHISLTIRKGESVGFIGPSGSGKSTLVDVILGLLPPGGGSILMDGQDIQTNLRAWQNQIGYVPQSIYLTDDTLRKNVAFGLAEEEIDDAAVQRAIRDAQLEEFVAGLPDGLETIVGERGARLSGGQRQRIGIARALYHDPAILVLDEATSALDTATEVCVMQAVMALRGGKTLLIVAHRLSTVEHCDRLYRLKRGKVVDDGLPMDMLMAGTETAADIRAEAE